MAKHILTNVQGHYNLNNKWKMRIFPRILRIPDDGNIKNEFSFVPKPHKKLNYEFFNNDPKIKKVLIKGRVTTDNGFWYEQIAQNRPNGVVRESLKKLAFMNLKGLSFIEYYKKNPKDSEFQQLIKDIPKPLIPIDKFIQPNKKNLINHLILKPGLKIGNKHQNTIKNFGHSGEINVTRVQNRTFDLLYYVAWLSQNGKDGFFKNSTISKENVLKLIPNNPNTPRFNHAWATTSDPVEISNEKSRVKKLFGIELIQEKNQKYFPNNNFTFELEEYP